MRFIPRNPIFPFRPLRLLILLLFWPSVSSWAGPVQETLPNGLKVFILENPGTQSVSVDLWIKAGSRYEPPGSNGISHMVEHLLFRGTSQRSAQDISREMASVGGDFNAFTYWEYTQMHISILHSGLDLGLEILADIAQNSQMTEEMIEKERKVVLEEISLGNIFPPTYVLNLVSQTLFPEDPLGMPIAGTKETVNALKREELLKYYRRFYVGNNALLTVIGKLDPPKALEMVRTRFASWQPGPDLPSPFAAPSPQQKFQEISRRKFLDQAIVVVALQAMGIKDSDRPVFEVINALLGSGGNSRLYQEIREKRALSYLVGSLYHPLSDTGFWATYAGTDPKNIGQVRSIMLQQIQRLQQVPLSSQELEDVKNYLRGRTLIRNEKNSALADFISREVLAGTWETPEEFLKKIQEVNSHDVMRVAKAYLREDRCNLIILKPYPGIRLFRNLF